MLGDDLAAALPELRAQAESMMLDTVTITRPGETVTAEDGTVTTPAPVVYQGRARWKPPTTTATQSEIGTAIMVTTPGEVHIPASAAYCPQPGDIIECTASVFNPSLVGRRTVVRSRFGGSLVTAYRIPIQEA